MKIIFLVLAALLFAIGIHAALVEYSYTGKGSYLGAGYQETVTYSGIMIYDTGSSNVTFVSWRKIDKTYHVNTSSSLHFATITGAKSKTYTVIAGSGSETDADGFYHLSDYMISGQNAILPIAANATFVFPKRLKGSNNREIYPDADGNPWLEIWGETMTFSSSRTKLDNNANASSDDAVNSIVALLQGKGYSER